MRYFEKNVLTAVCILMVCGPLPADNCKKVKNKLKRQQWYLHELQVNEQFY